MYINIYTYIYKHVYMYIYSWWDMTSLSGTGISRFSFMSHPGALS